MGKISLILPVYNEELIIEEVLRKYIRDLEEIKKNNDADWEIIAVNDGSTDGTHLILLQYAKIYRNVKVVTLTGRFGKQAAVTAGFAAADGDAVMLADIDLLNPTGILTRIYTEWQATKTPIIHGYREFIAGEKRKAVLTDFFMRLATKLFMIDGRYNGKVNIALYSADAVGIIRANPTKNKYIRTMDNWVGWTPKEIWYASEYNKEEIIKKTAELKHRHGDSIIIPRDKGRENSAAKTYAWLSLCFAIISLGFAAVTVSWKVVYCTVVLFAIFVVLIVCSGLFFLKSLLMKRIGFVRYKNGEIIYEIKSILNK
jgi:glycosyltransferase involved in cell wall biosynthesis